jgi:hypothetical protein
MRKSLMVAFVINLVCIALVAVAAFSWGYYGSITSEGISEAGTVLFGGLPSLLWSLLCLALLAAFLWLVLHLHRKNEEFLLLGVVLLAVVIAGFGIWQLVSMPSDQIGAFIALVVVAAVQTALLWMALVRNSATRTVPFRARLRSWRNARANNRTTVTHTP